MKLVLDLDSTLCTFTEAWCVWLKEKYNVDVNNQDIKHYSWPSSKFGKEANDFFKKDPNLAYKEWIKPIPLAHEFIKWAKSCRLFDDVYILTHAEEEQTSQAKIEFVKKHFSGTEVRFFSKMNEKYKHLSKSILIDDYPLHGILNAAHNGNHSIVFNYMNSYGWANLGDYWDLIWKEKPNLKHIHIANSYKDVIDILKDIKK